MPRGSSAMKRGSVVKKRGIGSDVLGQIGGFAGRAIGSLIPFRKGGKVMKKRGVGGDIASQIASSVARKVGDMAEAKLRSLIGLKRGGRAKRKM